MLGVLYCFPSYFLRQGLLKNQKLAYAVRLVASELQDLTVCLSNNLTGMCYHA